MSDTQVWMCYGCCCGVHAVDIRHKPRREPIAGIRLSIQSRLAEGGGKGISIVKTGCLGPCEKGNMVVVRRPGVDAAVFQSINTSELGAGVADYALDLDKRGRHAAMPPVIADRLYGTITDAEVPPPPDPAPYADRHR